MIQFKQDSDKNCFGYLIQAVGITASVHQLPIGIELTGAAPRIRVHKQRPNVVGAWREDS